MKTAGKLSSVTPVLPYPKTVLISNTEDNIKLHSVPCRASSTVWTTKVEQAEHNQYSDKATGCKTDGTWFDS